ncbi:Hypothetical predicted protein [Pelobates cultripes]|uniref:Uncharacterized protein n=1 Tax=Pelobates cultripes TaxID=61616 RepID=A0AAD1WVV7_PELCU|nr:Hypothetical predicted protein [Pelobates cultripes]
MTAGMVNTDVREDDFRESLEVKGTEETVPVQSGDFSDNYLTTFEPTQTADTTPDDMSALYTGPHGETVINVTEKALPVLRQGPLLVVELEDVAFQQSDVQKSHSGESTVEMDQSDVSAQKSVEIGGESSSEEAETETPVIERRGLHRKARGIKGPAKRRTKLSV